MNREQAERIACAVMRYDGPGSAPMWMVAQRMEIVSALLAAFPEADSSPSAGRKEAFAPRLPPQPVEEDTRPVVAPKHPMWRCAECGGVSDDGLWAAAHAKYCPSLKRATSIMSLSDFAANEGLAGGPPKGTYQHPTRVTGPSPRCSEAPVVEAEPPEWAMRQARDSVGSEDVLSPVVVRDVARLVARVRDEALEEALFDGAMVSKCCPDCNAGMKTVADYQRRILALRSKEPKC